MKKTSRFFHIDDALFVLALMVPSMVALARYVETAAQTSAIVLSQQQHRTRIVSTSHDRSIVIAQQDMPTR
jgi:hypothetical protein